MRVVVVGGGFAGIAAAKAVFNKLAFEKDVEVMLIDKNSYTTMLPSLPDILGNRIPKKYAIAEITDLIPRGVKFVNREINEVDMKSKTIKIGKDKLKYDYLIFSPGSKTNLFNFDGNKAWFYKLDGLDDALIIREDFFKGISSGAVSNVVIVGGGYTGIEMACNLSNFSKESGKKVKITIVDRANRILPMLGENLSTYAKQRLVEQGIEINTEDEVESFDKHTVILKSGKTYKEAMLYWCPGVKISLEAVGNYKKLPDGRIIVNERLQIPEHPEVFVAGDSAAVKIKDGYLRRGVNFAGSAGNIAGKNVGAIISGERLRDYKPKDLGWVIPIFTSSVGVGFGKELKGKKGVFLHYIMCGLKNYNRRNIFKYFSYGFKFPFRDNANK